MGLSAPAANSRNPSDHRRGPRPEPAQFGHRRPARAPLGREARALQPTQDGGVALDLGQRTLGCKHPGHPRLALGAFHSEHAMVQFTQAGHLDAMGRRQVVGEGLGRSGWQTGRRLLHTVVHHPMVARRPNVCWPYQPAGPLCSDSEAGPLTVASGQPGVSGYRAGWPCARCLAGRASDGRTDSWVGDDLADGVSGCQRVRRSLRGWCSSS